MTTETTRKQKWKVGIPKGYIGVAEVCELLGCSRKRVHQLIADQEAGISKVDFPESGKFGGLRIWKRAKFMTWMENLV